MGIAAGGVEFYAGPASLGAPDYLDTVIRSFIADAKTSLQVAVQELDSRAIAEALLAAKVAEIQIGLVREGSDLVNLSR